MEQVQCDLAVLGGGLAGMMAALEFCKYSRNVALFMKGKPGASGSSSYAGGGLAAAFGADDSPAHHAQDTISAGRSINDRALVDRLSREAAGGIRELEKLGVVFGKDEQGFFLLRVPGHSRKRGIRCAGGGTSQMMQVLHQSVIQNEVRLYTDCAAVDIMADPERGHALLVLDEPKKRLFQVYCRALIFASGGAGALFPLTTMSSDLQGDGYALALRAGLSLRDMEFIQFTPTAMAWPESMRGTSTGGMLLAEGAHLTDRHGRRFMEKYNADRMEASTRDIVARAIYSEITQGNGTEHGGVYLHLSPIDRSFLERNAGHFLKRLAEKGIDPTREPLEIAPAAHFFMGGIKIDHHCRTAISGIFACGEVSGGLHGANRLSSNGLTEALVFGRIAGRTASRFLEEQTHPVEYPAALPSVKVESRQAATGDFVKWVRQIQGIMLRACGIVRNVADLRTGLADLQGIQDRISELESVRNLTDPEFLKVRSLALVGQAVAVCALTRTESRGAHYRKDFPKMDDDKWRKSMQVHWHEKQMIVSDVDFPGNA